MSRSRDYYRALVEGKLRGLWPMLLRGGLRLASVPYGWATGLRNHCYDHNRWTRHVAPVPVVSIGNLTLGGTGKTPCVEYVARYYQQRGLRVAILSRGYGATDGYNDEAHLLEENLPGVPHLQGRDRVGLAHAAVARFASQVLVLDDGFQHRRLARDLDIVLMDATAPWGHGHLFPRGLLREAPHGLRRARLVLITRCDLVIASRLAELRQAIERLAPGIPIVESSHRPRELVNGTSRANVMKLVHRPAAAFCGIGNPEAFRQTLLNLGLNVIAFRSFPDHHAYPPRDVRDLNAWAETLPPDTAIVTTQKDLVKLRFPALGTRELWALRVSLLLDSGREAFAHQLDSVVECKARLSA